MVRRELTRLAQSQQKLLTQVKPVNPLCSPPIPRPNVHWPTKSHLVDTLIANTQSSSSVCLLLVASLELNAQRSILNTQSSILEIRNSQLETIGNVRSILSVRSVRSVRKKITRQLEAFRGEAFGVREGQQWRDYCDVFMSLSGSLIYGLFLSLCAYTSEMRNAEYEM